MLIETHSFTPLGANAVDYLSLEINSWRMYQTVLVVKYETLKFCLGIEVSKLPASWKKTATKYVLLFNHRFFLILYIVYVYVLTLLMASPIQEREVTTEYMSNILFLRLLASLLLRLLTCKAFIVHHFFYSFTCSVHLC